MGGGCIPPSPPSRPHKGKANPLGVCLFARCSSASIPVSSLGGKHHAMPALLLNITTPCKADLITCCQTEIEAADQTCGFTQLQHTDTVGTTRPGKAGFDPRISRSGDGRLTAWPSKWSIDRRKEMGKLYRSSMMRGGCCCLLVA